MRKVFTFLVASLCLTYSSFSQNRALHFDGSDDHVQIPARTGVLTGSAITFEAWVKPSSLSGSYMPIVNKGDGTNFFLVYFRNDMDIFMEEQGNIQLNVFLYNGSSNGQLFYSISEAWVNQWHHIAVTYSGSTLSLYVDGVLVTSTPFSGAVPVTSESVWFGRGGSWDFFSGTLDEVRIWNVVRSQTQIQANMNKEIPVNSTGLAAYYRFNQGFANGNNSPIATLQDHVAGNSGSLLNFARTGTSSNFTSGYAPLTVLAIKEGSFTAARKGSAVQLDWKSIASEGASFFTVERSSNGVDFAGIGSVNGISSNKEESYSFTDASPMAANNYYRIKLTEAGGKVSFTKVLAVALNRTGTALQAFPNPATASLQLQITAPKGKVVVELKDMASRTIETLQLSSPGTPFMTTLDVSKLAKGMYVITVGKETTIFQKQ